MDAFLPNLQLSGRLLCFREAPETTMTSGVVAICPLSNDRRSIPMICLCCVTFCLPITQVPLFDFAFIPSRPVFPEVLNVRPCRRLSLALSTHYPSGTRGLLCVLGRGQPKYAILLTRIRSHISCPLSLMRKISWTATLPPESPVAVARILYRLFARSFPTKLCYRSMSLCT